MPVESWTEPGDAEALAASATMMIDAALTGSGLSRDAYWAAVRKGYNTPYNDPPRRRATPAPVAIVIAGDGATPELPVAAMAAAAVEAHAG